MAPLGAIVLAKLPFTHSLSPQCTHSSAISAKRTLAGSLTTGRFCLGRCPTFATTKTMVCEVIRTRAHSFIVLKTVFASTWSSPAKRSIYPIPSNPRHEEDEIFVYCMSTDVSKEIGRRFGVSVAVEITKPHEFLARVRSALAMRRRLRARQLVHQEVHYYEQHDPPIVDWALPERIAMRKPASFAWQKEYRLAVPAGNAFAVENVHVKLVSLGAPRPQRALAHPTLRLKLGRLKNICRVHVL